MEYYIYIKIFHYWAFVSWLAMLFYLPRLFVYHVENISNSGFVDVVKIQEEKLYKYIGYPALFASLISGILMMVLNPSLFTSGGWLHAKILFILFLIAYHISLRKFMIDLREDRCKKSGKFFRYYNEIPTVLMIAIIVFVVAKPF